MTIQVIAMEQFYCGSVFHAVQGGSNFKFVDETSGE